MRDFAVLDEAHEYCHHLFGMIDFNEGSHFDGRTYSDHTLNTGNLSRQALMMRVGMSNMSAYERYRLGWLTPTFINANNTGVVLNDSRINNTAIMIPLRYNTAGNLKEYYMIENFQSTNSYAQANPFNPKVAFTNSLTREFWFIIYMMKTLTGQR